ncbi:cysteine peptidase family C39 domain-containing protein [Bacillus swezeyi]|uniref:Butirosin biosynthesis protein H N-terminal domain-containing protein n=1 Tax=Bacillus swezeyi TaxID=1925020 RepID=A0A5M8RP08_9BACI|nr:hypothetical protein [Bacillus swezeyi]KAA6447672.1 hypothetical protein DX927_20650 [Bacillus swezeyi]KAA6473952.1 hypothetical protein DX928_19030 [Bacillus swezeyi]TYS34255.1 hypothetical protein FZC77_17645 [Bacillus swezeyi]
MTFEKHLPHIRPFNEVFYRSCFFNCYFSVVRSFREELYPYLLNDIFSYQIDEDGYIHMDCTSVHNPEKLMNLQGIFAEKQSRCDELIENVKNDVLQEKPVIIWLDTHAQPYRPEYLSKHYRNCVLIFGFNDSDETASILENRYLDNLSYEIRKISYGDLIKGYTGFHDHFKPDPTFHSYAAFTHVSAQSSLREGADRYFRQNINQHADKVFAGLERLKMFVERLHTLGNTEKLLDSFNQVMNIKKVEQYRLSYLTVHDQKFGRLLTEIIQEWEKARYHAAKLFFSNGDMSDYEPRIKASLERILQLETDHCEWLMEACRKKERTE